MSSPADGHAGPLDDLVALLPIPRCKDERGSLLPLEWESLPFEPRRIFTVSDMPAGTVRGGRGHQTCTQLLVAVAGQIEVQLARGGERWAVLLTLDSPALLVRAARSERLTSVKLATLANSPDIVGGFRTPERSVSTIQVANLLQGALKGEPSIELAMDTRVTGISCAGAGHVAPWRVAASAAEFGGFGVVVNALWERYLPAVKRIRDHIESVHVDGGWVYAAGQGQLADPQSSLHQRTDFGIEHHRS